MQIDFSESYAGYKCHRLSLFFIPIVYDIEHQHSLGSCFDYVSGDGYYGNSIELAEAIEAKCYVYMLDIHSNLTIYFEESGNRNIAGERKSRSKAK